MKDKIARLLEDILAYLQALEDRAGRYSGIVHEILAPIRSLVHLLQVLLQAAGDPDALRRSAQAYRTFANDLQKFIDEQMLSVKLKTVGRPDEWCDQRLGYGANDLYADEFANQYNYLRNAVRWATALADAMDDQAKVLTTYLANFEDYVYAILIMAGGVLTAATDLGAAVAFVSGVYADWKLYRDLLKATPAVISSTCEETWPKPSFM